MRIHPRLEGRFADMVGTVERFWTVHDRAWQPGEDVILVDLQHNDLNCLLVCLTVAKYLSYASGAGVCGVIGQNATQRLGGSPDDYDTATVTRLGRAFGINTFLGADADSLEAFAAGRGEVLAELNEELDRFDAAARPWFGGDPAGWPAVAGFATADGDPLGRVIADSAARVTGDPRPGEDHASLWRQLTGEALLVRALGRWVADTVPLVAYVTSHVCYAGWGTLAQTTFDRGGTVVAAESHPNGPWVTFARRRGPGERVGDARGRALAAAFAGLGGGSTAEHRGLRAKGAALLGSPLGPGAGYWSVDQAGAVDRSAGSAQRSAARAKLGLPDGDPRSVAFVVAHCATDAARQESGLFDDYHDWLGATLRVAREVDDRVWVVRLHPWYRLYKEGPTAAALVADLAATAHIVVDDGLLSKDEYFSACDLAVTVRGTAGYELARHGIPVVAAGHSWYADAGFAHVPDTVADYEALLRAPAGSLEAPPGAVDAARSFSVFASLLCPLASTLCPPRDDFPFASLMADVRRRYRSTTVELDPAFAAVTSAWRSGAPAALNGGLVELVTGAAPSGPAVAAEQLRRWAGAA